MISSIIISKAIFYFICTLWYFFELNLFLKEKSDDKNDKGLGDPLSFETVLGISFLSLVLLVFLKLLRLGEMHYSPTLLQYTGASIMFIGLLVRMWFLKISKMNMYGPYLGAFIGLIGICIGISNWASFFVLLTPLSYILVKKVKSSS